MFVLLLKSLLAGSLCCVSGIALYVGNGDVRVAEVDGIQPFTNSLEESLQQEHATGFEKCEAGSFDEIETEIGTWRRIMGAATITRTHARSGKQALHLQGGKWNKVDLELAGEIDTSANLVFWAERWTAKRPFSFRIKSSKDGRSWQALFNGDEQVVVGRSYLSKISVPLRNRNIKYLRFEVQSPARTGVLIDDLAIVRPRRQTVQSAQQDTFVLPVLIRNEMSPVMRLRIKTEGELDPVDVREIVTTPTGNLDLSLVESFRLLHSTSEGFTNTRTIPGVVFSSKGRQFRISVPELKLPLIEGEQFVWLAVKLKPAASIDSRIGFTCSEILFSDGNSVKPEFGTSATIKARQADQRVGVAVRRAGEDGVHTYRIPGLATTKAGTLIGVYDIRYRNGRDLPGDIDVGMSRSTDGGQTWEPMKKIMDMGNAPQWKYDGVGDPSILVDEQTGTIWVAGLWSHGNRGWFGSGPGTTPEETGQFLLVKSNDDGKTWSKPMNITEQIKAPEWCLLLQGPGKGITMRDGTLVFPAQYQDAVSNKRLPYSTIIFSRDHGQTWEIGKGAFPDTTEAQVIETEPGTLMLNCRFNRSGRRVVMTTDDMGETWTEHPTSNKALIEPRACQASLIDVSRELDLIKPNRDRTNERKVLLFSNPNSSAGRKRLTIKASLDNGLSWPKSYHLLLDEGTSAGYSCLSMIDEETVGILYEGSQSHMTFQRVKLAEILKSNTTEDPPATREKRMELQTQQLSFAPVFGSHMVLQSGQPIRVWGRGPPHQAVTVGFGANSVVTKVSANGEWTATLPPPVMSAEPQVLSLRLRDDVVELADVLVGEVWLCAGQSNMEFALANSMNGRKSLSNLDSKQLRLMSFRGAVRGIARPFTDEQLGMLEPERFAAGEWQVADANNSKRFSAIGFYFAEELRKEMNCPIGLIDVSSGGTPIEAWVPIERLRTDEQLAKLIDSDWLQNQELPDWCVERAKLNLSRVTAGLAQGLGDRAGLNHPFKPGFMYESTVASIAPMSIRGVLWYQGESNAESLTRIEQHRLAFPLLVQSWRTAFKNRELPFATVQLPSMNRIHWPVFRELQRRDCAAIKNIGLISTIDLGSPNDVHPKLKKPVGERLARWAHRTVYGGEALATGPIFRAKTVVGDTVIIDFDMTGEGLKSAATDRVPGFELAGRDGRFHAATARIVDTNRVAVSCDSVAKPQDVRYAWAPYPIPRPDLTNSAGLPAGPFTTVEHIY